MRYGIFSDVHSNLEALLKILDFYRGANIDKYIFLGDIVGYGANPHEVIALLQELNPEMIVGNHDWAATGRLSTEYFNSHAQAAVQWTKGALEAKDIAFLNSLNLTYHDKDFICVHGNLIEPRAFHYITDIADAQTNFVSFSKRLCFVGHSHKKENYCLDQGRIFWNSDDEIKLRPDCRYIINTGSVGQPRDGDPRACACVYDSDKQLITFNRVDYNIAKASKKILDAGLPQILASRLYSGW